MISLRDVIYLIGLVFTMGGMLWWLARKFQHLEDKMDEATRDIKEIKDKELIERLAVVESKLKIRRVK